MYDFGSRFYDPLTSSWLSRDPVEEFTSPYLYAATNPIMLMDPNGMDTYKVIRGSQGEEEIDLDGATDAAEDYFKNLPNYDSSKDGIVVIDVTNVEEFEDAIVNNNDYGDIAGIIYLGHSGPNEIYVNMTPGTADVTPETIENLSPKFTKNAFFGLASCNSASMAQYISEEWQISTFGNSTKTKGIPKIGGLPVGRWKNHYDKGRWIGSQLYPQNTLKDRY